VWILPILSQGVRLSAIYDETDIFFYSPSCTEWKKMSREARKHLQLTAVDLMAYSSVGGGEKPAFLLQSTEVLEPFIQKIQEEMLRATLYIELATCMRA
jgi:hypothetical protein